MKRAVILPFSWLLCAVIGACESERKGTSPQQESDVVMVTCTYTPKPLPASPAHSEKIIVYNWPGQCEPVSLNRAEQTEYVQSCDFILEVDAITDEIQFSVDTETAVKRHYHVSRVLRGSMPSGGIICDEYYLEHLTPEDIQPLISTELPQNRDYTVKLCYPVGKAWLCLRSAFLNAGGTCIDRSKEAYCYQYFLYGEDAERLINKHHGE